MRPNNNSVSHLGLRQVRQFARAADVGYRRQQIILPDGPQQRVGRHLFGARGQFRVVGILAAQRGAFAFVEQEEERGLRVHVNLRVIAGVGQFFVARQESGFQFRHGAQRLGQKRRADFAHGGVQRIQIQQVQFGEQRLEQRAESGAHGALRGGRLDRPGPSLRRVNGKPCQAPRAIRSTEASRSGCRRPASACRRIPRALRRERRWVRPPRRTPRRDSLRRNRDLRWLARTRAPPGCRAP